jgi:hypothetical protein
LQLAFTSVFPAEMETIFFRTQRGHPLPNRTEELMRMISDLQPAPLDLPQVFWDLNLTGLEVFPLS